MLSVIAFCSILLSGTTFLATPPDERVALELSPDGTLAVNAEWSPIADSTYKIHEKSEYARYFNLKPAQPAKTYSAAAFQTLLPAGRMAVGDVWALPEEATLDLLRQFHPAPTTAMHHGTGGGGGFACLRAVSPQYAEIALRLQAEFVLEPQKAYYTPAQFAGRLLIDRKERRVVEFVLELPDRNSNVDINVLPYADIVYVPRMRLGGGTAPEHIEWAKTVALEEARSRLAAKLYKFAGIRWTPFAEALDRAKAEKKPLHVVVLFGTLDDESC